MQKPQKENQKPVHEYTQNELLFLERQIKQMQRHLSVAPHQLQATATSLRLMELDNYVSISEIPNELLLVVKHFIVTDPGDEFSVYANSIKTLLNVSMYFNDLNAMKVGYWLR